MSFKQWLESRRSKIRMSNWPNSRRFGSSQPPSSAISWSSPMQPASFTYLNKCQIRRIMAPTSTHTKITETDSIRIKTSWTQLNPWRAHWWVDAMERWKREFQIKARTPPIWSSWWRTNSAQTRLIRHCRMKMSMNSKRRSLMNSTQYNRARSLRLTKDSYSK